MYRKPQRSLFVFLFPFQQWQRWALLDTGRAEMPLTAGNEDTYPVGIGICLNSNTVIKLGMLFFCDLGTKCDRYVILSVNKNCDLEMKIIFYYRSGHLYYLILIITSYDIIWFSSYF